MSTGWWLFMAGAVVGGISALLVGFLALRASIRAAIARGLNW